MCGRYASSQSTADLATLFGAQDETEESVGPAFNIAPTDSAPVVRVAVSTGLRVVSRARWGLVPHWSADLSGGARMINARVETVATSRAFGPCLRQRRCLVPADGWYEWARRESGSKQAFFMTREDGTPVVFAGVWSAWGGDADKVITFSVITMPAEGDLAMVHDRMPLVLEPGHWRDWLGDGDPAPLLASASPGYLAGIERRPVSARVGDVRQDGPELTQRVDIDGGDGRSGPSTRPVGDVATPPLF